MNFKISNDTKREKWQASAQLKSVLITSGIISSLMYVITDIIASVAWRDYSYTAQTFSELIAVDAPTRPYVTALSMIYSLLIYAYGVGVWLSADGKRALRIAAVLIIAKEILGEVVTLFFPLHMRGVEGNYSDIMHGALTVVGVFLCMFPAMIAGVVAYKGKFRHYTIVTMALFVVFGVLAGLGQPNYALNLPTPMMGIFERINIYGYMLWIIVLSKVLLHLKRVNYEHGEYKGAKAIEEIKNHFN
jgi:hypothetical protein